MLDRGDRLECRGHDRGVDLAVVNAEDLDPLALFKGDERTAKDEIAPRRAGQQRGIVIDIAQIKGPARVVARIMAAIFAIADGVKAGQRVIGAQIADLVKALSGAAQKIWASP